MNLETGFEIHTKLTSVKTASKEIILVIIMDYGLCKCVRSIVNRGEFDLSLALLEL